jgi:uncharacterized Zn finger protein
MCKHVAAALYGVGARLDEKPELIFVLRGVDENELLADAGRDLVGTGAVPSTAKLLGDSDVAALFGLEMAESAAFDTHVPAAPKRHRGSGTSRAFSSEVDPGSRQGNASKQETRAPSRFNRSEKGSRGNTAPTATKAATAKKSKSPVAVRKKSGRKAAPAGTGKGGARRRSQKSA